MIALACRSKQSDKGLQNYYSIYQVIDAQTQKNCNRGTSLERPVLKTKYMWKRGGVKRAKPNSHAAPKYKYMFIMHRVLYLICETSQCIHIIKNTAMKQSK